MNRFNPRNTKFTHPLVAWLHVFAPPGKNVFYVVLQVVKGYHLVHLQIIPGSHVILEKVTGIHVVLQVVTGCYAILQVVP